MTTRSCSALAFRAALVLAAGAIAWTVTPPTAKACSCAKEQVATYIAKADTVFLGKVGRASGAAGKRLRTYKVLHSIKGNTGSEVKLKEVVGGLCSPMRRKGEVVAVFVRKGVTGLCAGNFSQEVQLEGLMSDLLIHLGGKRGAVSLPALKTAVTAMMKGYTHKRPTIEVVLPALTGKRFKVGKTAFVVVAKPAKDKRPTLKVTSGVMALGFAHVGIGFAEEGIVGNALLRQRGKSASSYKVIAKSVYER